MRDEKEEAERPLSSSNDKTRYTIEKNETRKFESRGHACEEVFSSKIISLVDYPNKSRKYSSNVF
jgi:lipopolysaccharide export system protein LptC